MGNAVSLFSTLELNGFHGAPERPFADNFLSFNGRKVTYVKDDSYHNGYTVDEETLDWHETWLKVAITVAAILTIVPAVIFAVQKYLYQNASIRVIQDTENNWAKRRDAFSNLREKFPQIVSQSAFNSWYTQDIATLKTRLDKEKPDEAAAKSALVNFYRTFTTDDDYVTLVGKNREWKVNRYLACRQVEVFAKAFTSKLKEGETRKLELKAGQGDFYPDEAIDLLVSYLNSGDTSGITFESAEAMYALAHEFGLDDLVKSARSILLQQLQNPKVDGLTLFRMWQWAEVYNEAAMLMCAQAFCKLPQKEYPGYNYETTQMRTLGTLLQNLKANVGLTDKEEYAVVIERIDIPSLEKLEPYLKMDGISTLDFSKYHDRFLPTEWLCKILNSPDFQFSELRFFNHYENIDGAKRLIQALNSNEKVTRLDITSFDRLRALLAEMKNNRTIETLNIYITISSEETFRAILEFAYTTHPTLSTLHLVGSYESHKWYSCHNIVAEVSQGALSLGVNGKFDFKISVPKPLVGSGLTS